MTNYTTIMRAFTVIGSIVCVCGGVGIALAIMLWMFEKCQAFWFYNAMAWVGFGKYWRKEISKSDARLIDNCRKAGSTGGPADEKA